MIRKSCAGLLCALLFLSLAACAKPEAIAVPESQKEMAQGPQTQRYVLQESTITKGDEAVFFQQAEENGFLAIINRRLGERIPAELAADPNYVHDGRYDVYENGLYHINRIGKASKIRRYRPLPAPEKPEGLDSYFSESRLRAARLRNDGSLVVIESSYESWQDPASSPQFQSRDYYYIRLLQADGAEIQTSRIQLGGDKNGLDCGNLVCLENDVFAVPKHEGILFFDADGAELFTVSTPLRVKELCRCPDGRLAVILEQNGQQWLSLIRAQSREVSVPQELPEGAHGFCATGDGHMLFRRNTELFSISLTDYSVNREKSLLTIGIDPVSIAAMYVQDDGSLHFLLHDWMEEEETQREVYVVAKPRSSGRIPLRIGFSEISGSMKQAILAFNRGQESVLLQALDFRNGSGTAGDADLLVLDEAAWRIRDRAGLLSNLEPLTESDIISEPVRNALRGAGGLLTRLALSFRIESMCADYDTVGGRTSLSFADLQALLNAMPAGSSLYEPYYTSERLLEALREVNPVADAAKLTAFSTLQPEFYDYRYYAADTSSMEKRIYDGRLLLLQAHIGTLEEYKYYDTFFRSGASFVGWPTENGSKSRLVFDECIALSAECTENQRQGAAVFLHVLLAGSFADGTYGFPVQAEKLEKLLRDDMAARSFRVDEDGEYVLNERKERIEIARTSWYTSEWRRHYDYALTEWQYGKLMNLIWNSV